MHGLFCEDINYGADVARGSPILEPVRFISGETGCLKVFGRSHFGDSFAQSGVDFPR